MSEPVMQTAISAADAANLGTSTAPAKPRTLRWARGINRTSALGTYLFGLVLGLLPCGLIYAALVAACALATPLQGAAGMLMFGLGTVPILAIIGVAGQIRALRGAFTGAAPWLLVANAVVLVVAAIGNVLL